MIEPTREDCEQRRTVMYRPAHGPKEVGVLVGRSPAEGQVYVMFGTDGWCKLTPVADLIWCDESLYSERDES